MSSLLLLLMILLLLLFCDLVKGYDISAFDSSDEPTYQAGTRRKQMRSPKQANMSEYSSSLDLSKNVRALKPPDISEDLTSFCVGSSILDSSSISSGIMDPSYTSSYDEGFGHRVVGRSASRFFPVSYTHLTLPTICSV